MGIESSMKPGEKCAVTAVVGENAAYLAGESLLALQHRGPEASGIATQMDDGELEVRRGPGLVRDVFSPEDMARMSLGKMSVGHNRYSTSGSADSHLQPVLDDLTGFAFAHNGNLPITQILEPFLSDRNIRTKNLNDSEMMAHAIAQHIRQGLSLPDAIQQAYPLFRGAFSCVAMHDGQVAAFRDPMGIRPLALGRTDDGYVVASETCGLDSVGAKYDREIRPGELLLISESGLGESRQLADGGSKLDLFEFIYFARPDSNLYGQSVNEVRRSFGEQLAYQHPPLTDDKENILVVPIPDTSVPAAEGYAETLGLQHRKAIEKSRYVGRTFLQPTQEMRELLLRRKHSLMEDVVKGRDVIFVDDSIVRLNTIPELVRKAHAANARSVTVLIASPPVRFPDFYGIDTPQQSELAAANMTVEQMRERIGCLYLGFLSLSNTIAATGMSGSAFNLSCFNGEYPIGIGDRKKEIYTPVSMEFAD